MMSAIRGLEFIPLHLQILKFHFLHKTDFERFQLKFFALIYLVRNKIG